MTTTDSRSSDLRARGNQINLDLIRRVLKIEEDVSPWHMVWRTRQASFSLPQLVLSIMERDGVQLGSGSSDELARARKRALVYQDITSALTDTSARTIKGPSLSKYYPEDLCRPVGDLDLIVESEKELWRVARVVANTVPVEDVAVSLFGAAQEHMAIQLRWPGMDPLLDSDMKVEISTAAFPGDFEQVEVRSELPTDQWICNLLSIAEERFQRQFGVKDFCDVFMLAGQVMPELAVSVEAVERAKLAPELVELLQTASAYGDISEMAKLLSALERVSAGELERRAGLRLGAESASGRPVHGLLLRQHEWREGMLCSRRHGYSSGTLLCTPMGDYMMTDNALVSQQEYIEAIAVLTQLATDDTDFSDES
jgi:hypothetical protein